MMNIVTRELTRRITDRRLQEFVSRWDGLEVLVIRVFRSNAATAEDEITYQQLKDWLGKEYPHWQDALRTHWQSARVAGEIAAQDPFLKILAAQNASAFAAHWEAMQTLPAAREALNSFLLSIIEQGR